MKKGTSQENWPETYRQRRNWIRKEMGKSVILWIGHILQPRNFPSGAYSFRQNSHFLYYTGLSEPDMVLLSFPEPDHDILFSKPESMDDIVWTGPKRSQAELVHEAGIDTMEDLQRAEALWLTLSR